MCFLAHIGSETKDVVAQTRVLQTHSPRRSLGAPWELPLQLSRGSCACLSDCRKTLLERMNLHYGGPASRGLIRSAKRVNNSVYRRRLENCPQSKLPARSTTNSRRNLDGSKRVCP